MELMDCTLYDYISRNNATLTLSQRKSIIRQLLRAYSYLHSKSVFHRDVSPRNALVKIYDDTIVVKISDFGLVKIAESDLTSENSELKGSLNDPALKVLGFGKYELRHELYAITLLLVFVLTGKLNWSKVKNPSIKEFMEKVRLQILIKDSKPWMNYSKAFEIVSNSLRPIVSLVRKLAVEPI